MSTYLPDGEYGGVGPVVIQRLESRGVDAHVFRVKHQRGAPVHIGFRVFIFTEKSLQTINRDRHVLIYCHVIFHSFCSVDNVLNG